MNEEQRKRQQRIRAKQKERPTDEELGDALRRYTDPNDPEYDPKFDKEIRKLRPDWFDDDDN